VTAPLDSSILVPAAGATLSGLSEYLTVPAPAGCAAAVIVVPESGMLALCGVIVTPVRLAAATSRPISWAPDGVLGA
jgi:hypothetical protein